MQAPDTVTATAENENNPEADSCERLRADLQHAMTVATVWGILTVNDIQYLNPVLPKRSQDPIKRYQLEDFAVLDKRLPSAIDAVISMLIARNPPGQKVESFFTFYMTNALRFWENSHLVLPVEALTPSPRQEQAVRNIFHLDYDAEKRCLSMEYSVYRLMTAADGTVFPCEYEHNSRMLWTGWLDENYPGWESQMLTAKTLDTSLIDAFLRVMTPQDVAQSLVPPTDIGHAV